MINILPLSDTLHRIESTKLVKQKHNFAISTLQLSEKEVYLYPKNQRKEMESFYRTHAYLVEHTNAPVRRDLMDEINWGDRLIGIKGTRGVGKTTFLLQYAKEKFGTDRSCLFINMNNFYFSGHSLVDFANEFQRRGGKVLLIDQVFNHPDWSKELRMC